MPQPIAHDAQPADRPIELIRLGDEHLPIDAQLTARLELGSDFIQRKAGDAAQGNQGSSGIEVGELTA